MAHWTSERIAIDKALLDDGLDYRRANRLPVPFQYGARSRLLGKASKWKNYRSARNCPMS